MSSRARGAKKKGDFHGSVIAINRGARFHYNLGETFEAGIALVGSEVKSLREGHASIHESYIYIETGEAFWVNAHINAYDASSLFNHEPKRKRKLLLHVRELKKLHEGTSRKGMTIVPMRLYFTKRGYAKLFMALGTGKKLYDVRQAEKEKDWKREQGRLMRHQVRNVSAD